MKNLIKHVALVILIVAPAFVRLATAKTMSTVLEPGHKAPMWSVAVSPTQDLVASADSRGVIKVFNYKARSLPIELKGHSKGVAALAFSPDGKVIASGGDAGNIFLWDVDTWQKTTLVTDYPGGVTALAYSPDGLILASGSGEGIIKIWNLRTGGKQCSPMSHGGRIESLSFNHTSNILASGGKDEVVRLWDTSTCKLTAILEGHENGIRAVAFNPKGDLLASGDWDGNIYIWKVDIGQVQHRLNPRESRIESLAWNPTGNLIASGSGMCGFSSCFGDVKLFSIEKNQEYTLSSINNWTPGSLKFDRTGTYLICTKRTTIDLWEINRILSQASTDSENEKLCSLIAVVDYSGEKIREIQSRLMKAGYDPGITDGRLGPKTRRALASWKKDSGCTTSIEWAALQPVRKSWRHRSTTGGEVYFRPPEGCYWECSKSTGCRESGRPMSNIKPRLSHGAVKLEKSADGKSLVKVYIKGTRTYGPFSNVDAMETEWQRICP